MPKYRMVVAYDGTHYAGWQVQPHGVSIQATLEARLAQILRQPVAVTGASRTDAGVHARGQVAHFLVAKPPDLTRLLYSLNCLLPADIRVLELEAVPEEFHARYSTLGKLYHYLLCTSQAQDPFARFYAWHYPYPLNLAAMREAALLLTGTHDFTSFANVPTEGAVARNPVRTLSRLAIIQEGAQLRFEVEGNGFLHKMVRNIVGTLVEVGSGKPRDLQQILQARDRRCAGPAAPARGLCLERIFFS
jgi:tRNA pseudouridine38-40 synthase